MTLYMIRGDTVTAYASPPARGSEKYSNINTVVWLREPDSNPHYRGRIDDSLRALDCTVLRGPLCCRSVGVKPN